MTLSFGERYGRILGYHIFPSRRVSVSSTGRENKHQKQMSSKGCSDCGSGVFHFSVVRWLTSEWKRTRNRSHSFQANNTTWMGNLQTTNSFIFTINPVGGSGAYRIFSSNFLISKLEMWRNIFESMLFAFHLLTYRYFFNLLCIVHNFANVFNKYFYSPRYMYTGRVFSATFDNSRQQLNLLL